MQAQHQSSNPHHIIHIRECNESNCSQMMDEHDQEVLETEKKVNEDSLAVKQIQRFGTEPQN